MVEELTTSLNTSTALLKAEPHGHSERFSIRAEDSGSASKDKKRGTETVLGVSEPRAEKGTHGIITITLYILENLGP